MAEGINPHMGGQILGVGTDIVDCTRIREIHQRYGARFLDRTFCPDEQSYCLTKRDPAPFLAARFAAKEAFRKALSQAPALRWLDVEVRRDARGPVTLELRGSAQQWAEKLGVRGALLSIAHERSMAVATVLLTD